MRDIADLVVIVWASLFGVSWLWRVTDPDPTRGRVRLSQAEISASQEREPWARAQLAQLATAAGLRSVPSFGVANAGAYYIPLRHRIQVSRAYLARLSDAELRLILAHEVGHTTRRWKAFSRRTKKWRPIVLRCASQDRPQISGDMPWSPLVARTLDRLSARTLFIARRRLDCRVSRAGLPFPSRCQRTS